MYEEVLQLLKKYNQEHLLNFYNELDAEEREELLNQILHIDFETIKKLYDNALVAKKEDIKNIEPLLSVNIENISQGQREKYTKCGEKIVRDGKYAVVTMAGGQGTRLGHDGPKGTYMLSLGDKKVSLFEIFCNQLKEANEKYDTVIPWYIMTSKDNDEATKRFFLENNYWGYDENKIYFFKQCTIPMVNISGKILLEQKYKVKEAADGNGGLFKAIAQNDIIDILKENKTEWIFTCGVDNPLVKMCDPIFIGFNVTNNYLIGAKSMIKAYPSEKVGVFCKMNGVPNVIEYMELPEELASKVNLKSELMYGDSYIVMSLFNIHIVEELLKNELPFHVAFKKATYIGNDGEVIEPLENNAYKFETFLFDAFTYVSELLPYRIKREEEFAPIKNKEGADSPDTAIKLYIAQKEKIARI